MNKRKSLLKTALANRHRVPSFTSNLVQIAFIRHRELKSYLRYALNSAGLLNQIQLQVFGRLYDQMLIFEESVLTEYLRQNQEIDGQIDGQNLSINGVFYVTQQQTRQFLEDLGLYVQIRTLSQNQRNIVRATITAIETFRNAIANEAAIQ